MLIFSKKLDFGEFLVHPPMASVLLSALRDALSPVCGIFKVLHLHFRFPDLISADHCVFVCQLCSFAVIQRETKSLMYIMRLISQFPMVQNVSLLGQLLGKLSHLLGVSGKLVAHLGSLGKLAHLLRVLGNLSHSWGLGETCHAPSTAHWSYCSCTLWFTYMLYQLLGSSLMKIQEPRCQRYVESGEMYL